MTEIFSYAFFQHAVAGSILASILCGIIGTYIVTRRLVFIGGGIAHASLGGVGIGAFLGFAPLLGAAAFSLFAGYTILWLSSRKEVREDSSIAMIWTFGMSIGILCTYLSPNFMPELSNYLFGNILTITVSGIVWLFIITLASVLLFLLLFRTIVAVAFDKDFASSQGIPVTLIEYVMMTLMVLSIVACLRLFGIVLVISMLSIPQMTANVFTQNFKTMIFLSILFGIIGCFSGLAIAYLYDVPSGASIILVSIIIYIVSKAIKKMLERFTIEKRQL